MLLFGCCYAVFLIHHFEIDFFFFWSVSRKTTSLQLNCSPGVHGYKYLANVHVLHCSMHAHNEGIQWETAMWCFGNTFDGVVEFLIRVEVRRHLFGNRISMLGDFIVNYFLVCCVKATIH